MGIGRWIGPGMTVGWHSFDPRVDVAPVRDAAKVIERRRPLEPKVRRRVTRRPR